MVFQTTCFNLSKSPVGFFSNVKMIFSVETCFKDHLLLLLQLLYLYVIKIKKNVVHNLYFYLSTALSTTGCKQ